MARPVSARLIALDVLDRVLGEARPLEDSFAGHPALALLDTRDRAFARLLVTTALRRLGQIDAALDRFMRRAPRPPACTTCSGSAPRSSCSWTPPRTPPWPRPWRSPPVHMATPRVWSMPCCGGSRAKARTVWRARTPPG